jgi:hypothetical protein
MSFIFRFTPDDGVQAEEIEDVYEEGEELAGIPIAGALADRDILQYDAAENIWEVTQIDAFSTTRQVLEGGTNVTITPDFQNNKLVVNSSSGGRGSAGLSVSNKGTEVVDSAFEIDLGSEFEVNEPLSGVAQVEIQDEFDQFIDSGDGETTVFKIPHSLGTEPSATMVQPLSEDSGGVAFVEEDEDFVYVHYDTPPPAGSQNIGWNYLVRV